MKICWWKAILFAWVWLHSHVCCETVWQFLCKERLVKLAYCITEYTVRRLVVVCGTQCLFVSAVLTNDILVSSWAKFVCGFFHCISLSLFSSNGCCNSVPLCCAGGQVYCYLHFFNSQVCFLNCVTLLCCHLQRLCSILLIVLLCFCVTLLLWETFYLSTHYIFVHTEFVTCNLKVLCHCCVCSCGCTNDNSYI